MQGIATLNTPRNSSLTTLDSIIIPKNTMLSIQNKLQSKKQHFQAAAWSGSSSREAWRGPGRTCARPVFCLENSMSPHKKYYNFFLRQDFCLRFFCCKATDLQYPFLAKTPTLELSAKILGPKRAARWGNKKVHNFSDSIQQENSSTPEKSEKK